MFRSYISAGLFLSLLLIFGGCAKKTVSQVESLPAPPVAETVSAPAPAVTEIAPVALPSIEALIMHEDKRLETVLFDYDSYALTTTAQQILKSNAEWLAANPGVKTTLEGYCDERGSDEYNLALGERRALATKNYFASLGVAPERFAIISYGEENPASTGHNEIAWKQNRRVEFNVAAVK